jgi:hypothetical protein
VLGDTIVTEAARIDVIRATTHDVISYCLYARNWLFTDPITGHQNLDINLFQSIDDGEQELLFEVGHNYNSLLMQGRPVDLLPFAPIQIDEGWWERQWLQCMSTVEKLHFLSALKHNLNDFEQLSVYRIRLRDTFKEALKSVDWTPRVVDVIFLVDGFIIYAKSVRPDEALSTDLVDVAVPVLRRCFKNIRGPAVDRVQLKHTYEKVKQYALTADRPDIKRALLTLEHNMRYLPFQ